MRRIGEEAGLSYTVHLPLDTRLGSADEKERVASVGKCKRVIERMRAGGALCVDFCICTAMNAAIPPAPIWPAGSRRTGVR